MCGFGNLSQRALESFGKVLEILTGDPVRTLLWLQFHIATSIRYRDNGFSKFNISVFYFGSILFWT
jgi:hypothetical protein